MIVLGMFEMSRAITISDSIRTTVIASAREAGIARTTSDEVIAEMEEALNHFRVRSPTVVVTQAIIDDTVVQLMPTESKLVQ